MKKNILVLGALALTASAAFASPAHGNFYAGAGLGWASMSKALADSVFSEEGTIAGRTGMAARVHFGYMLPVSHMSQVGAEVGYTHFPDVKKTTNHDLPVTYKLKSYGLDMLAVAKFNVTDTMSLFAKAGFIQLNRAKHVDPVTKLSSVFGEAALGVGYTVMPNLDATLTYAHVFDHGGEYRNNSVLAGFCYCFNV